MPTTYYRVAIQSDPNTGYTYRGGWSDPTPSRADARAIRSRAMRQFLSARVYRVELTPAEYDAIVAYHLLGR